MMLLIKERLSGARRSTVCIGASALLLLPAAAQTRDEANRLEQLRACAQIANNSERLACFDREAAAVLGALEAGDFQVLERREIERTRRSLFGFTLPKLDIFGSDEAPDTLETTITGVRALGPDAWAIQVAEGSVWQITNAPSRLRAPKAGDIVVIKKAALGSFFIRVAGQLGVKGRRMS